MSRATVEAEECSMRTKKHNNITECKWMIEIAWNIHVQYSFMCHFNLSYTLIILL